MLSLFGTYVGRFEGVRIYETHRLGSGEYSAGLALPGFGIIIGDGTYSQNPTSMTLRHEFGHILQAIEVGYFRFYILIGIPSLLSAWFNWHGKSHQHFWTETWANSLSKQYFKDVTWPDYRFPPRIFQKKGWKKIFLYHLK